VGEGNPSPGVVAVVKSSVEGELKTKARGGSREGGREGVGDGGVGILAKKDKYG